MSNYKNVYIDDVKVSKPYFYMRNGLIHVKGNFDKCIELSTAEVKILKDMLQSTSYGSEEKQDILYFFWQFCEKELKKPIIQDGLSLIEKRIKGEEK